MTKPATDAERRAAAIPEPLDAAARAALEPLDAAARAALDPEVRAVLDGFYLDYRGPLTAAWSWNRAGTDDGLGRADQLLAVLDREFPHTPLIWYERAFNLVKRKRRADALRLLEEFGGRYAAVLDVDTLALWGRCLKDQADEYRAAGQFAAAEAEFAAAEAKYDQAYKVSKGDRFPGINVATLRLLRAAVLKRLTAPAAAADTQNRDEAAKVEARIAALREGSRERAAEVLASRPGWTRTLPDDDIWMTATAAEAAFLQSDWALAEQLYRAALRPENQPLPHHFASAGGQLVRLTEAFAALGTPPPPPFDRPAQFLSALQPKPETLP